MISPRTALRHLIAPWSVTALLLGMISGSPGQGTFTLRGRVTDAQTGEPLIAATIRVAGTARGTITNARGDYVLTLTAGEYRILYRYLSYQNDSASVSLTEDRYVEIGLQPSPVELPEFIVLAEDPALEIVRKAIANKRTWKDKLQRYTFDAFTRHILRRDTAIASITESYTTGYQLVGDTLREIVRQKRQTENIPMSDNFASVRRIVNFNDDEITLFSIYAEGGQRSGYTFIGPTAPDALDHYDYRLLRTASVGGVEVYVIRMTPKTRLRPLFDGIITIADVTFAVMGVDVRPNETLVIPFIRDLDLRYRQQFSLYDDIFWMPTDIRINGGLAVSIVGFSLPRIGIDLTSSIYDYRINVEIPDSMFRRPTLMVDSAATRYDSTFWREHEVLPLTSEEQLAYRTLDSTQTLERQFKPSGPLASLGGEETGSFLEHLDIRYNRVEGLYLGGNYEIGNVHPLLSLRSSAGFGFSDNDMKYNMGGSLFISRRGIVGVGVDIYHSLEHVPDRGFYAPFTIAMMALIDKNDYRDYYLASGWTAFLQGDPNQMIGLRLSFLHEQHTGRQKTTDYSLFSRQLPFRDNPGIHDGSMRSIRLDLRLGRSATPLDLISRNALEVSVEHSSPRIAGSEFDFTRFEGSLWWTVTTFSGSLLFPPTIRLLLSGGTSRGDLPAQRIFVPDTRSSGVAPFGVLRGAANREFAGDRYVMLNLEHNFRSLPFLALNLPFLYRNGIEVILHGSIAQTWQGSTTTSDGWFSESGVGISRIFDILRFDFTYRFTDPRRFYVSLSTAQLF